MNDHNKLCKDLLIQTSVGIDKNFVNSYRKVPKEIILDFYGADYKVHVNQLWVIFHGYYHNKCFLPLYVFCGNNLLVGYLRPVNVHDSKHSWAILKLFVKKNRSYWPKVKIIFGEI